MESIADKSRNVRRRMLDLISHIREKQDIDPSPAIITDAIVADALERFTLWAGNLGARRGAKTKLSLDHRLAAADDIRKHICRQLDEITEAVDDLTSIVKGTSPNRDMAFDRGVSDGEQEATADETSDAILDEASDGATDEAPDEAHMIIEVISQSISSLFRIGMLVRKSTPRDRFKRALQADVAFPAFFDIDYVRHKHPKIKEDWLSARLGGGIAKRRQFIKYCRDHRSRLGADEVDDTDVDATRTEALSSKATTFVPHHGEGADDDAVSMVSASTATESLSALKLPALADISKDDQPFECPICFTLQSFQTERSWRVHAFRDLKPYVCTLGKGECDAGLFGDRDSWFEHELKEHRARYSCSLCGHGPLGSRDIRAHIQSAHGPFPDDRLRMLQDAGREAVTEFRAQDCPFCHDWADILCLRADPRGKAAVGAGSVPVSASRFKRHVAMHQEQLAIFALPRAREDDDSPGSASVVETRGTDSSDEGPGVPTLRGQSQDAPSSLQGTGTLPDPAVRAEAELNLPVWVRRSMRLARKMKDQYENENLDLQPYYAKSLLLDEEPEQERDVDDEPPLNHFDGNGDDPLLDARYQSEPPTAPIHVQSEGSEEKYARSGEGRDPGGAPGPDIARDQYEYTRPGEVVRHDRARARSRPSRDPYWPSDAPRPSQTDGTQGGDAASTTVPDAASTTAPDDKSNWAAPPGARWTKINRAIVNPEALTIGKERFEIRDDFVIVLRALSKEEIQAYAAATQVLRARRRGTNERDREESHGVEEPGRDPS